MARTTMADLITQLREYADASVADFTVNGVAYWTDDQLQTVLDGNRREVRYLGLAAQADLQSGGSVTYSEYWSGLGSWEDSPTVLDANYGTVSASAYTFDASDGVVTFTNASSSAAVYFIRGTVYNVHAAAAQVWIRKAAQAARAYDVSTDNHSLKRSQLAQQAGAQARTFSMMRPSWEIAKGALPPGSVYAERGDFNASGE